MGSKNGGAMPETQTGRSRTAGRETRPATQKENHEKNKEAEPTLGVVQPLRGCIFVVHDSF